MSGPNYLAFQAGDGPLNRVTWPNPFADDEDQTWRLVYGTPTRADLLWASSVQRAYTHLFQLSQRERNRMVSLVKAEANRDAEAEDD